MTWRRTSDLPENVRRQLPLEAQGQFLAVASASLVAGDGEQAALRKAWGVVRKLWTKPTRGRLWMRRPDVGGGAACGGASPRLGKYSPDQARDERGRFTNGGATEDLSEAAQIEARREAYMEAKDPGGKERALAALRQDYGIDVKAPRVMWHGTVDDVVSSIKEKGIVPQGAPGGDTWGTDQRLDDMVESGMLAEYERDDLAETLMRRGSGRVFLTSSLDRAKQFATTALEVREGKPVVFRVEVPADAVDRLRPDDATNVDDMFMFKGKIPPAWIKEHFTTDPVDVPWIDKVGGRTIYVMLIVNDRTVKYSPDQERDERGRFTDMGGGTPLTETERLGLTGRGTPHFRAWFEGSKVASDDGTPLRAYHGTTRDFAEFDTDRSSVEGANPMWSGDVGSWFTARTIYGGYVGYTPGDAAEAAGVFSLNTRTNRDYAEGARIVPVYLSIKNPKEYMGWSSYTDALLGDDRSGEYRGGAQLRAELIDAGHDGIVVRGSDSDGGPARDDWVAFHPEQIKSATSSGYDPGSPDFGKYSPDQERDEDGKWIGGGVASGAGTLPGGMSPEQLRELTSMWASPDEDHKLSTPYGDFSWAELAPHVARMKAQGWVEKYSPDQARGDDGKWIADGQTGFTINAETLTFPKTGYAVGGFGSKDGVYELGSFSGRDVFDFLDTNAAALKGNHMGAWMDGGKMYLDVVRVYGDRAEAERAGRDRNQIAIADLAAFSAGRDGTINTGGTGVVKASPRFLGLFDPEDDAEEIFRAVMALRKYSPDQPRDEDGQWTSAAAAEEALGQYQASGGSFVNDALRAKEMTPAETAYRSDIKALDDAIDASRTDKQQVVWRGTTNADYSAMMGDKGFFTDPAYVSTSLDREVAEEIVNDAADMGEPHPYLLRITVPKGAPAHEFHEDYQSEVLLARGAKFKLTGVDRSGPVTVMSLRYQPPKTVPPIPGHITKYSPDQPRDEAGRFASGGSSSFEEDDFSGGLDARFGRYLGAKSVTLFHGTADDVKADIMANGLRPGASPGGDEWARTIGVERGFMLGDDVPGANEGWYTPERQGSVFLTTDREFAKKFGHAAAEVRGGQPIVFKIEVPKEDYARFEPDEVAAPDDERARTSLLRYRGVIPPAWIKGTVDVPVEYDWKADTQTVYLVVIVPAMTKAAAVVKGEVDYRAAPTTESQCDRCAMFLSPDGCSAVEGDIAPWATCNLFEAKAEKYSPDQPRDERGRWLDTGAALPSDGPGFQVTESGGVQAFHGTKASVVDKILAEGLVARFTMDDTRDESVMAGLGRAMRAYFSGNAHILGTPEREASVFVADSFEAATEFAARKTMFNFQDGAVFELEIPESEWSKFKVDEYRAPFRRAPMRIPPEWIRSTWVTNGDDPDGWSKLVTAKARGRRKYLVVFMDDRTEKFSPDQPRDEDGKWTGGGVSDADRQTPAFQHGWRSRSMGRSRDSMTTDIERAGWDAAPVSEAETAGARRAAGLKPYTRQEWNGRTQPYHDDRRPGVKAYAGETYATFVNRQLRGPQEWEEEDGEGLDFYVGADLSAAAKVVENLDGEIAKSKPLQAPVDTYRAIDNHAALAIAEHATFTDPAFVSASLSESVATQHITVGPVVKVRLPEGAQVLQVKNSSERELIIPRGSTFRVSDVVRDDESDVILSMTWDLEPSADSRPLPLPEHFFPKDTYKYSPDQPRADDGKWTDGGGWEHGLVGYNDSAYSVPEWDGGGAPDMHGDDRPGVEGYAGIGDAIMINARLRNYGDLGSFQKVVDNLDKEIAAVPPMPRTLAFRGVASKFAEGLEEGTTFEDQGFVSLSLSKEVSRHHLAGYGGVVVEVRIPEGAKALQVVESPERELILPRGSKFRVVERIHDGHAVSKMTWELVPPFASRGTRKYSDDQPRDEGGRFMAYHGTQGDPPAVEAGRPFYTTSDRAVAQSYADRRIREGKPAAVYEYEIDADGYMSGDEFRETILERHFPDQSWTQESFSEAAMLNHPKVRADLIAAGAKGVRDLWDFDAADERREVLVNVTVDPTSLRPPIRKYSPDQARDQYGRWTLTGGADASPLASAGPKVGISDSYMGRARTIDTVEAAIAGLPESHRDFLDGLPVQVVDTLDDAVGAMGVTRNTYADADPVPENLLDASGNPPPEDLERFNYNSRMIQVADSFALPESMGGGTRFNDEVHNTITHEIGHAFDNLLRVNMTVGFRDPANPSSVRTMNMPYPGLARVYNDNINELGFAERLAAEYATSSPEEFFAEAYSAAYGSPKRAFGMPIARAQRLFRRSIEATRKVVDAKLYERFAG